MGWGMWGWGRGGLGHAIELTHRAICEFDLHQMTKGCQAAFWIQSHQKKPGWVVPMETQWWP
jgi:hypothetical protein